MTLFMLLLVIGITGLGLLHTYVIYPWHMRRLARQPQDWEPLEEFPFTVILMAAYNEEPVIKAKVQSIFRNHYPKSRLMVVIGTDACTDKTDDLILQLCGEYSGLHHRPFASRTGKPGIINQLYKEFQHKIPNEAILVLTDVDAIFEEHTLAELVLPFSNPKVAGVQANILPPPDKHDAFAKNSSDSGNVLEQEIRYMHGEMMTKQGESRKGSVIGGYGALMALRWNRFEPSPEGLIVDDFFWFARLLQEPGSEVVFAPKAIARMPLEGSSAVQFRRKRRLGKGNLQNLWIFRSLLLQRQTVYCFVSHKVLRWLSPWLLMAFYGCTLASITLYCKILNGYGFALNWLMLCLIIPAVFRVMFMLIMFKGPVRQKFHWIDHFVRMNIALALGAFDLIFKPSKNVWWDNRKNPQR